MPELEHILNFNDRIEQYREYIKGIEERRFVTGFPLLDAEIRGVAPGEVMTIIAYSGTYKSALLQNLLLDAAGRMKNHFQLMFSLEMPAVKCFEREIQMQAKCCGYDVEQAFNSTDPEWEQVLTEIAFRKGSSRFLVCDRPGLTVEDIGGYVRLCNEMSMPVGVVGIDYLGLMKGNGDSVFERTAVISAEVKNIAKAENVPVILLGQVNRGHAASQKKEIETDAAKGGGDVEAGADFMLGLYQSEEENCIVAKLMKNRNGKKNIKFRVNLDEKSLRIEGLEPFEEYKPVFRGRK